MQKVLLVFALLLVIGGIVGYVKKDSAESLIAGTISGAAIFLSCWLYGSRPQFGFGLGLIVSLALLGRFGANALDEGLKLMPGGIIIFFSVVTIVVLIVTFLKEREGTCGEQAAAEDDAAAEEAGNAEAEDEVPSDEA
ncbi:MAG: TMEM14 family protein [Planctomycetota bacterium]|nr:TMEM14 family protein [Planctomycetota bacterium]